MKLRKKMTPFLVFGSLLFTCFFTFSCKKEVLTEYHSKVNWEYVNHSSYDITVEYFQNTPLSEEKNMVLVKDETKTQVFSYESGEKVVKPDFFPIPFIDNCVLIINKVEHNVLDNTFFRSIGNYESVTKDSLNYSFTYTFTDDIISDITAK